MMLMMIDDDDEILQHSWLRSDGNFKVTLTNTDTC